MPKTHCLSHTKTYAVWKTMRQRCSNPNNKDYENYGGRGIKVCDRWDDYAMFYEDMGDAPAGHSIERQDNNGDYCPENCVWLLRKKQSENRRPMRTRSWANEQLVGQKFGRLLVLATEKVDNKWMFVCECECGARLHARPYKVKTGYTKSCGCLRREVTATLYKRRDK